MARKPRKKKSDSVKVNFKDVESRQTPPEGDYKVAVLEAVAGTSSNNNDQIEFTLEISEGKYKGTKLWFYCTLDENSLWKLHSFLSALGIDVPQDEMDIDLSELVGEECVAVVSHETYNGKKRAKMTDFDTLENYSGGEDEDDDEDEDEKPKKGKKSPKKSSKKSKKSDDDDDDDEEEETPKPKKKSKKASKKSDEDDDEDEDEKPAKKSKKKASKKKSKKYDEDDIEEMDEDELQEIIDEHDLDVDLDDFKKIGKKQAAVIDALEDEDLLED